MKKRISLTALAQSDQRAFGVKVYWLPQHNNVYFTLTLSIWKTTYWFTFLK